MYEFDPTGFRHRSTASGSVETLLWIGDRSANDFRAAFTAAEKLAGQVAYRPNLRAAMTRRAGNVTHVVLTRVNRMDHDRDTARRLRDLYPRAEVVELVGSLCVGEAAKWTEPTQLPRVFPSHSADFLAHWIGSRRHSRSSERPMELRLAPIRSPLARAQQTPLSGDFSSPTTEPSGRSVAVIAATLENAEPLLELACEANATAVWARPWETYRIRNVSNVWWDDSATCDADNTSRAVWETRIGLLGGPGRRSDQRHAWIVGLPNLEQCRVALDCGVDRIQTKPGEMADLVDMLTGEVTSEIDSPRQASRILPHRMVA